jgi:hypothetical protein
MKRVAIPVTDGKLSEYFGECSEYEVFEMDNVSIRKVVLQIPGKRDINRLPAWAARQGITDIITHKVDKKILSLFIKNKINFFIGVPVDEAWNIINEYRNGSLESDDKIIREILQQSVTEDV